jgi:hypothetical protein
MAARNASLEEEKNAFVASFRRESGHLVFSASPGGEGRVVSEDEAVDFVTEFMLLGHRHARRFGHSVWLSVLLLILFGTLGIIYRLPLLTGIGLFSTFGWWYTAIVQRIIRARFKYRVWNAVAHRPPVRALTRDEKVARGYALGVREWLWIGVALIIYAALSVPARALPPFWRDLQMVGIGVLIYGSMLALLAYGAFRLVRRVRRRGNRG